MFCPVQCVNMADMRCFPTFSVAEPDEMVVAFGSGRFCYRASVHIKAEFCLDGIQNRAITAQMLTICTQSGDNLYRW